MLQNKIKKNKINTFLLNIIVLITAIFFNFCGGKKKETLSELNALEIKLKTELSQVRSKINKLQGDSGTDYFLVEVQKIKPSFFKTYISAQGRVDAEESISVSSEIPGTISKIYVKLGDLVSKGQILAETDSRALQQTISDLQINSDLMTQLFEKQKALWDQKIGTEVQFLQAKTQKESMEKKLSILQEQSKMTKIISPINGTIDALDIKLGQLTAPGMPAIRVVNFNNLKIKADLSESYVSKVHKGNEVLIKFSDSNDTITSTIYYSSRVISQLNRTFGVEVLLNSKKEYHPNQIAVIKINDYTSSKEVMILPLKYIQKDLKGNSFVFIAEEKKATKRFVKYAKEYNGNVEIIEGIGSNDLIISEGFEGLTEGDLIKIKMTE